MVSAVSTLGSILGSVLRNDPPVRGSRTILLSSGLLFLSACAQLAGLEGPDQGQTARPGSSAPAAGEQRDTTLPPAPRTDCGDVANDATNCGYCEHSCRGGTCTGGFCSTTIVASSGAQIDAFVTDGADVFTIEGQAARACSIASATPDACREIVTGEQVGQRLLDLAPDFGSWGGKDGAGGRGGPGGPGKNLIGFPALSPRAIALQSGRVVLADDQYKVLVSCPTSGPCTSAAMGLVDAEASDDDDEASLGRSLAVNPVSVVWTQGDAIRGAVLPKPGEVVRPMASRIDDTTAKTARIVVPGTTDLLLLSDEGLHYASAPNAAPERWFARPATDFSLDAERVYVAGPEGLFRVSRADKSAALSAPGSFQHVAVDDRGVYATKVDGGRTVVVEARADKQLELAVVDGPIDGLAVAGDHVYFMVRAGAGSEIRRVAR